MGLVIDGLKVSVDHTINGHLLTEKRGNPTSVDLEGLVVHSVFKRLKNSAKNAKKREQKRIGDNCPLIYALKGKEGLHTDLGSIKRLMRDRDEILDEICGKLDGAIEAIVPVPSAFPLAKILAIRISRKLNVPVLDNVFQKATNRDAYQRIEAVLAHDPMSIDPSDIKKLRNTLKTLSKDAEVEYTSKNVPVSVRRYFDPLIKGRFPCKPLRLLLVDDLMASGETLLCCGKLLTAEMQPMPQHAVTWFSGVK